MELTSNFDNLPRKLPLVIALQGFSDAGHTISQLLSYIDADYASAELVYRFSNDDYLDYRSRRPTITFREDHLQDYDPPELGFFIHRDELGAPFLLLRGYEPDMRWEAFIETVLEVVRKLEVSIVVWAHSIPMPVPHTRPIGTTVSGNQAELIDSRSVWKPETKLSASVGHLLEYRLFEANIPVAGYVLLVSHYLASTDFPNALETVLDCIMDATGLLFSTAGLAEKNDIFLKQVNDQVLGSEESMEMLKNLETRYDEYMAGRDEPVFDETSLNIPTAEELASDFEDFLAEQMNRDSGDQGPVSEEP